MKQRKTKFDFESEEKREAYLKEIIAFFQAERGEEIGFVGAQEILDFFLGTFGEEIYRKGLTDAKKLLKSKVDDLEIEIDLLIAAD